MDDLVGVPVTTTAHAGAGIRCASGAIRLAKALFLSVLTIVASTVLAADGTLSEESLACLKCHEKPDIGDKQFDDGKSLSMRFDSKNFLASMHKKQDCTDCHSGLDDKTHGKVKTALKSRRELTQSMQESCRDCHKKKFNQYDDGIHAALIKEGNNKAPLCASCHNAHLQASVKLVAPIDQTPCASCHEAIFKSYVQDVHGVERVAKGKKAPICADCHRAHDVQAASLGEGQRAVCLVCHKDALIKHQAWLPNAELHFDAISCPACHAPNAARRVNLRLYDGVTRRQLREKSGVPRFMPRVQSGDAANLGLDEQALWSLLEQFSQDGGKTGRVTVRGRLEVRSGAEAHQLAPKSKALKDCDTCHKKGAEPFQSVVLTIAGPDGRPLRHDVRRDVLSSLTALESVRGFYAIGSTRIKLLDWLLAMVVAGSIGGCLAHMTVRRLFRRFRERAALPQPASPAESTGTDDRRPNGSST